MSLVFNQEKAEEKPEMTLVRILNVPDFVEKYLDIDTRLRLRKTCTTIREIINKKPLHIDWLIYDCYGKTIKISTHGGFEVLYEIIEEGLRVRYLDREKTIDAKNEEEQIEVIQRDLMSILDHGKLRIGILNIEDDYSAGLYDEEPPMGIRALRNTLNQLPNKLKIKSLEYLVKELDDAFIATLKTIEHLKSLQLSFGPYDMKQFKINLFELEEWKRLKSLKIWDPQLSLSDIISSYTHFENAHLAIGSFYACSDNTSLHNFVMELKDKLLQNPNLKQLKIEAISRMKAHDVKDIKSSLQQYNINNTPYPCWVSIPYPDSDKKLEMLVDKKMIWFKGPCYVKGEWEEDSSDEDDEDESDDYEDEEDDDEDEEEALNLYYYYYPQ
ncbi:hypothetical protein GCK72_011398 [Caenorhabditis remanei]|uniref:DUF38 domain-containing protein n=1 Tax=Caenorhabditis remanei TaxID=31234 RepID=A0A6A5H9Q2_CAERE|nr:hypothetical protein GCK72_011398 [Caenorhabditis remanei]KAF1763132.1 hypothetical protein GCK72_011398 [Caenorhabditis remanei]